MKYIIGDVHGCLLTLQALIEELRLKSSDSLYFLGDYIDRGPNSKGVLDYLMKLESNWVGRELVFLQGNHDALMLHGYNQPNNGHYWCWQNNGMEKTLKGFPNGVVSDKYLNFIKRMPTVIKVDNYYLAHAGIEDISNPLESDVEILQCDRDIIPRNHKVIVGHTQKSIEDIVDTMDSNKIILDGGCVFRKRPYGNLVALCLDTMELTVQINIERKKPA